MSHHVAIASFSNINVPCTTLDQNSFWYVSLPCKLHVLQQNQGGHTKLLRLPSYFLTQQVVNTVVSIAGPESFVLLLVVYKE